MSGPGQRERLFDQQIISEAQQGLTQTQRSNQLRRWSLRVPVPGVGHVLKVLARRRLRQARTRMENVQALQEMRDNPHG